MNDPRGLLNAYSAEYLDPEGECAHDCDQDRRAAAPKTIAALRAVLDLHPQIPGLVGSGTAFCLTCWLPGEDRMEPTPWPCRTVQAITSALESS